MDYVDTIHKKKKEIAEKIKPMLTEEEAHAALKDYHATRSPRPCGITIHPGSGCIHECIYCYIYDMGFRAVIKPYHLSGLQLVYALLANKYFIPGPHGTYLAIGSVTEPFHPLIRDKTMEYVEAIYKYLVNPVQFSTKQFIDKQTARRLAELSNSKISPLVTIVTVDYVHIIEPKTPKPDTRLDTIKNLRESGLKPFLFLRPIIPGITEKEYVKILEMAKEAGAVGVVAGSLRVTRDILKKMREAGLDTRVIERRAKVSFDKMKPGIQYDVYALDIKDAISRYARKLGLIYTPSACMANLYTHGYSCWRMCTSKALSHHCQLLEEPDRGEVEKIISELGAKLVDLEFINGVLKLAIECRRCDIELMREVIRSRYKICVKIKRKTASLNLP